jgi:hypothetical protein
MTLGGKAARGDDVGTYLGVARVTMAL